MDQVEEIKANATECQDLKSSITKLESELKTSWEQVGSLQAQFDTSLKESQDLENQLKAAKNQVNQHEKEIQAKNKEVEELKLQSERYLNSKYQRLPQHERVYHRLDLKSAKIEISKLCLQLLRVGTLSCLVSKISVWKKYLGGFQTLLSYCGGVGLVFTFYLSRSDHTDQRTWIIWKDKTITPTNLTTFREFSEIITRSGNYMVVFFCNLISF